MSEVLLTAAPFSASFLYAAFPPTESLEFMDYLSNYTTILVTAFLWILTAAIARAYGTASSGGPWYRKRPVLLCALILVGLCALLQLNIIKIKFGRDIFFVVLFLLGQLGLTQYFEQRRWWNPATVSRLFRDATLAYLVFPVSYSEFRWQVLLCAIGIACASTAHHAVQGIYSDLPTPASDAKWWQRKLNRILKPQRARHCAAQIFALCLMGGSLATMLVTLFGALPQPYLIVALVFPLASPLVTNGYSAAAGADSEGPAQLETRTRTVTVLYIAMIIFSTLLVNRPR